MRGFDRIHLYACQIIWFARLRDAYLNPERFDKHGNLLRISTLELAAFHIHCGKRSAKKYRRSRRWARRVLRDDMRSRVKILEMTAPSPKNVMWLAP